MRWVHKSKRSRAAMRSRASAGNQPALICMGPGSPGPSPLGRGCDRWTVDERRTRRARWRAAARAVELVAHCAFNPARLAAGRTSHGCGRGRTAERTRLGDDIKKASLTAAVDDDPREALAQTCECSARRWRVGERNPDSPATGSGRGQLVSQVGDARIIAQLRDGQSVAVAQ